MYRSRFKRELSKKRSYDIIKRKKPKQLYKVMPNLQAAELDEISIPWNYLAAKPAFKEESKTTITHERTSKKSNCKNLEIEAWLANLDIGQDELSDPALDELEVRERGSNDSPVTLDNVDTDDDVTQLSMPVGTNPFLYCTSDESDADGNDELQLGGEDQSYNFMQCIDSHCAVPEYALSDAVFSVDKPREAVPLGTKLPVKQLSEFYKAGVTFELVVSEVYSPFQFWFHDVSDFDSITVRQMSVELSRHFYDVNISEWRLPAFFLKPGYVCVARHEYVWKRARIGGEPMQHDKHIDIYLVDYGKDVKLPPTELYFLHRDYAQYPALAQRGTLTDVYPLGLHWPKEATKKFLSLVLDRELYALIKDIDPVERILFVSLSERMHTTPTISDLLINADLAGRSLNYSEESRKKCAGRRARYIRERLPTFDMLETNTFPEWLRSCEDQFDNIIYSKSFNRDFVPIKLSNPFLDKLQDELNKWLEQYKAEELSWRKEQQLGKRPVAFK